MKKLFNGLNKKQQIIVSITGIFIVLLILIGLTYAYFLTKIKGNDNVKSIAVSTANLELTYGDGNGTITVSNMEPGEDIPEKTFTVTNNGNATVDNYAVYLEELINTLTRNDDMVYTLTCTSSVANKTCNGVDETTFPNKNGLIVTNSIDKDEVQTYSLKLNYKEMGVDQSADMGKEVSAKIQIYDLKATVDIEGTVSNYTSTDYIQINSDPKKSQINTDGTYKLGAILPGTHTLRVYAEDGTEKASTSLTISKGTKAGVSGTTITITDDSRTATINIDATSKKFTIDSTIKDMGKFLKDVVIASAKADKNGTIYTETPLHKFDFEIKGTTLANGFYKDTKEWGDTFYENKNMHKDASLLKVDNDYYFRGLVTNNHVNFAGMCWLVTKIGNDGTAEMILDNQTKECNTLNYSSNWNVGNSTYATLNSDKSINYFDLSGGLADKLSSFQTKLNTKISSKYNKELKDYLNVQEVKQYKYESTPERTCYYGNESPCTDDYYNPNKYLYSTLPSVNKYKDGSYIYVNAPSYDTISKTGIDDWAEYCDIGLYSNYNPSSFQRGGFCRDTNNNEIKCISNSVDADKSKAYTAGTYHLIDFVGVSDRNCFSFNHCDYNGTNDFKIWTKFVGGADDDYYTYENNISQIGTRPSIILKADIEISKGDGTLSNPYIVK